MLHPTKNKTRPSQNSAPRQTAGAPCKNRNGTRIVTDPGTTMVNPSVFRIGADVRVTVAARQPPQPYCKINAHGRKSRRSRRIFQGGFPGSEVLIPPTSCPRVVRG